MKLKDLSPNPQNPRKITDDKLKMLKASLDNFGDLSGIVFNRTTQTLSGGHQRLKCLPPDSEIVITSQYAEKNKQGTVAVGFVFIDGERYSYREVEWDELTEKAANLAANTHGGEWDNKQRIEWLLELEANNYPIEITGLDKEEQEDLMAPFRTMPEGLTDVDEVPEGRATDIKLGDLFELGSHRLLCGDSTDHIQVERLMNGEKADMVFTDPPYNLNFEYNSYNDDKTPDEYRRFCEKWFTCLPTTKNIITPGKQNIGMWFGIKRPTDTAVWLAKNKMSGGKISNLSLWEPILFYGDFDRNSRATDIFEFNVRQQKDVGGHTCPKIIALVEDLISSYSKIKEIIVDVFLGSGTTLIACEKTNRKCYGMEIDPSYCQVIIDRWEQFTGKKAVKL